MQPPHDLADLLRPLTLELRPLRLVAAIHEAGGVTGAGERLHLTQSALSHQLQEIEGRLGVELFRRVRRRLVLSGAGERVLAAARRVLPELQALEDELGERGAGRRGTLRVTTECYTAYDWLPPVLRRFARLHPGVDVQIVPEATGHAVEAVLDGEVDLALVTGATGRELDAAPVLEDELLLVTAPDHPLAARPHVTPADLTGETLLLYSAPPDSNFYQQFLAGTGVRPRKVVQVQLTEAMVAMIRAGIGVGVFARWAIRAEIARRSVAAVRLGARGLQREWKAVSRRRERAPAYLRDFARLLAEDAAATRGRFSRAG